MESCFQKLLFSSKTKISRSSILKKSFVAIYYKVNCKELFLQCGMSVLQFRNSSNSSCLTAKGFLKPSRRKRKAWSFASRSPKGFVLKLKTLMNGVFCFLCNKLFSTTFWKKCYSLSVSTIESNKLWGQKHLL